MENKNENSSLDNSHFSNPNNSGNFSDSDSSIRKNQELYPQGGETGEVFGNSNVNHVIQNENQSKASSPQKNIGNDENINSSLNEVDKDSDDEIIAKNYIPDSNDNSNNINYENDYKLTKTGEFVKNIFPEQPNGENDQVGFYHIAEAIGDIIRNPKISPPFNIGIIGNYGSGKTKIIKQLINYLSGNSKNRIIEFDVGRYHNASHIWEALIYDIYRKFTANFTSYLKYIFLSKKTIINYVDILLTIGAIILSFFAWKWSYSSFTNKMNYIYIYILPLLPTLFFMRNLFRIWNHPIITKSLKRSFILSKDDIVDKLGYRLKLEKILEKILSVWLDKSSKAVIIIDNLDRCNPKEVLEIVNELFSLMSTEGIMNKLIAVIAVDENALIKAINKRDNTNPNEYFEKLFSLKVNVPLLDGQLYRYYLSEKINLSINKTLTAKIDNQTTNILSDCDISDDEKNEISRQILRSISNGYINTPRKIMRIIFAYQFIKYLWPRWEQKRPAAPFNTNAIIFEIVYRFNNHKFTSNERTQTSLLLDIVCPDKITEGGAE